MIFYIFWFLRAGNKTCSSKTSNKTSLMDWKELDIFGDCFFQNDPYLILSSVRSVLSLPDRPFLAAAAHAISNYILAAPCGSAPEMPDTFTDYLDDWHIAGPVRVAALLTLASSPLSAPLPPLLDIMADTPSDGEPGAVAAAAAVALVASAAAGNTPVDEALVYLNKPWVRDVAGPGAHDPLAEMIIAHCVAVLRTKCRNIGDIDPNILPGGRATSRPIGSVASFSVPEHRAAAAVARHAQNLGISGWCMESCPALVDGGGDAMQMYAVTYRLSACALVSCDCTFGGSIDLPVGDLSQVCSDGDMMLSVLVMQMVKTAEKNISVADDLVESYVSKLLAWLIDSKPPSFQPKKVRDIVASMLAVFLLYSRGLDIDIETANNRIETIKGRNTLLLSTLQRELLSQVRNALDHYLRMTAETSLNVISSLLCPVISLPSPLAPSSLTLVAWPQSLVSGKDLVDFLERVDVRTDLDLWQSTALGLAKVKLNSEPGKKAIQMIKDTMMVEREAGIVGLTALLLRSDNFSDVIYAQQVARHSACGTTPALVSQMFEALFITQPHLIRPFMDNQFSIELSRSILPSDSNLNILSDEQHANIDGPFPLVLQAKELGYVQYMPLWAEMVAGTATKHGLSPMDPPDFIIQLPRSCESLIEQFSLQPGTKKVTIEALIRKYIISLIVIVQGPPVTERKATETAWPEKLIPNDSLANLTALPPPPAPQRPTTPKGRRNSIFNRCCVLTNGMFAIAHWCGHIAAMPASPVRDLWAQLACRALDLAARTLVIYLTNEFEQRDDEALTTQLSCIADLVGEVGLQLGHEHLKPTLDLLAKFLSVSSLYSFQAFCWYRLWSVLPDSRTEFSSSLMHGMSEPGALSIDNGHYANFAARSLGIASEERDLTESLVRIMLDSVVGCGDSTDLSAIFCLETLREHAGKSVTESAITFGSLTLLSAALKLITEITLPSTPNTPVLIALIMFARYMSPVLADQALATFATSDILRGRALLSGHYSAIDPDCQDVEPIPLHRLPMTVPLQFNYFPKSHNIADVCYNQLSFFGRLAPMSLALCGSLIGQLNQFSLDGIVQNLTHQIRLLALSERVKHINMPDLNDNIDAKPCQNRIRWSSFADTDDDISGSAWLLTIIDHLGTNSKTDNVTIVRNHIIQNIVPGTCPAAFLMQVASLIFVDFEGRFRYAENSKLFGSQWLSALTGPEHGPRRCALALQQNIAQRMSNPVETFKNNFRLSVHLPGAWFCPTEIHDHSMITSMSMDPDASDERTTFINSFHSVSWSSWANKVNKLLTHVMSLDPTQRLMSWGNVDALTLPHDNRSEWMSKLDPNILNTQPSILSARSPQRSPSRSPPGRSSPLATPILRSPTLPGRGDTQSLGEVAVGFADGIFETLLPHEPNPAQSLLSHDITDLQASIAAFEVSKNHDLDTSGLLHLIPESARFIFANVVSNTHQPRFSQVLSQGNLSSSVPARLLTNNYSDHQQVNSLLNGGISLLGLGYPGNARRAFENAYARSCRMNDAECVVTCAHNLIRVGSTPETFTVVNNALSVIENFSNTPNKRLARLKLLSELLHIGGMGSETILQHLPKQVSTDSVSTVLTREVIELAPPANQPTGEPEAPAETTSTVTTMSADGAKIALSAVKVACAACLSAIKECPKEFYDYRLANKISYQRYLYSYASNVLILFKSAMQVFEIVFQRAAWLSPPEISDAILQATSLITNVSEWFSPVLVTILEQSAVKCEYKTFYKQISAAFCALPAHLHLRYAVQPLVAIYTDISSRWSADLDQAEEAHRTMLERLGENISNSIFHPIGVKEYSAQYIYATVSIIMLIVPKLPIVERDVQNIVSPTARGQLAEITVKVVKEEQSRTEARLLLKANPVPELWKSSYTEITDSQGRPHRKFNSTSLFVRAALMLQYTFSSTVERMKVNPADWARLPRLRGQPLDNHTGPAVLRQHMNLLMCETFKLLFNEFKDVLVPNFAAIYIVNPNKSSDNDQTDDIYFDYIEPNGTKIYSSLMAPVSFLCRTHSKKEVRFLLKSDAATQMDNRICSLVDVADTLLQCSIPLRPYYVGGLIVASGGTRSITSSCAIIEFIDKTMAIGDVYAQTLQVARPKIRVSDISTDFTQLTSQYSKAAVGNMTAGGFDAALKLVQIYADCVSRFPPFTHLWWPLKHTTPAAAAAAKARFTESYANWCALGWLVMLGDRHHQNIMIFDPAAIAEHFESPADRASEFGRRARRYSARGSAVAHIDFDSVLNRALRLPVPETMSFRMTPMIIDLLGSTSGSFRATGIHALSVMSEHRVLGTFLGGMSGLAKISSQFQLFIDGLVIQEPTGYHGDDEKNAQRLYKIASDRRNKILRDIFYTMSSRQDVAATNPQDTWDTAVENYTRVTWLSQMYPGWSPTM